MKNSSALQISGLVIFCILLNLLGKRIAIDNDMPLWLDAFGTAIAAYALGPVSGALVGLSGNIIFGVMCSPTSYIYGITSIGIGVAIGIVARRGWFEDIFGTISASVVVTTVSVIISTPLNIIFYDGHTGNVWGDGVFEYLTENNAGGFVSSVVAEFYVDFLDKVITMLVLFFLIRVVRQNIREMEHLNAFLLIIFLGGLLTAVPSTEVFAKGETLDFNTFVQTVYSRDNGLPCGEANDVVQTKDGVLWVGTYAGLYRYNGSQFSWINEFESIRNVNCMYVDEEGRLWIGTNDNGLSIIIDESLSMVLDESDGLPSNSVRCITQSSDGLYYIGTTSNLQILDLNGGLEQVKVISQIGYATAACADERGHVVIVSTDGGLHLLQGEKYIWQKKLDSEIEQYTSVFFDKDGLLYVGTSENNIDVFELTDKNKLIKKKTITCEGMTNINDVMQIEDGRIIICSDTGIGYLKDSGEFERINAGSFNNSIDSMAEDYQGNLWFTSSRMGLLRLAESDFLDVYNKAGIEGRVVNTVAFWQDDFYVGTDTGLDQITRDMKGARDSDLTRRLDGVRIRCIKPDSAGNLWICTYGLGLWEVFPDGRVKIYDTSDGSFGNRARVVIELSDGSIAAAGDTGVSIIRDHKVQESFLYKDGLSNDMILCLLQTNDGKLLAGSDGDGIAVIEDGEITDHITEVDGLPSGVILRIVRDTAGEGYYLVTSNCLCYLNPDLSVRKLPAFPYYNNYDIWEGSDGKLFVLSSAGIYVVDRDALFRDKDLSYDLLDNESGLLSALTANSWNYKDENGYLYLSCDTGTFRVDTGNYGKNRRSYRMQIAGIKLDNKDYSLERGEVFSIPRDTTRLELFPEVINYTTEDPTVRYRLEGLDNEYTYTRQSELSSIVYTNLPNGDYTLSLAVLDGQNKVIEEGIYRFSKETAIQDTRVFKSYMIFVAMIAVAWLTWFLVRIRIQSTLRFQEKELELAKKQLSMGNETILAIAKAVDAKDVSTSQHSQRVSEYSVMIGRELGFSDEELENLRKAALLHDIGKIGIPDRILNKPDKLTDAEYEVMKSHVTRGGEILKDFTLIDHVEEGARYHHERYDGTGYMSGLKGEEIPLYGRIIAVADAFDAMTANRVYRKKLSLPYVVSELKRCSGSQFDPVIADIMLRLIDEKKIDVEELFKMKESELNMGSVNPYEADTVGGDA